MSVLIILASLPSFEGECASELDTRTYESRAETRQFMDGSDESPVSRAWIWLDMSSKHSSSESKPENAPNSEKWGVHICAGMNTALGQQLRVISSRSRQSRPSIGLPSERIFPMAISLAESSSASSRPGRSIRLCTLRTLPFFL